MTSGTTGASLSLPVSRNVEPDQWAVWWRYRGWHGIKRGEHCALFAAAPVVIGEKTQRPYRFNFANNEIRFSIFHISPDAANQYVSALNRHKPAWVHGKPTAIALLAKYMLEQDLPLAYRVRTVTVGSENLLPWQRNVIEKVFGTPPRQHYGLVEAVANISECPAGRLHVDEDFSYVEFVQEDVSDACGIVGTAFSNIAVSLLRYHTGDLARLSNRRCECGRWGRIVEELDGRLNDYVVLPGGKKVASLAAPFHDTECLLAAQIYQGDDGSLSVRYVPGRGWKNDFLVGLESRLRLRVGHQIAITFEQVNEVEKTARGKTRLVVSGYKESNE
jgi:phenylacetate-CoA ligase